MQQMKKVELEGFIGCCKEELYNMPLEKAVLRAEEIGFLLRCNQTGIYSLGDVEQYLINQMIPVLSDYNEQIGSSFTGNSNDTSVAKKTIFLATEVYHTGGHSRLMEHLATFLDVKPDLLLSKNSSETIITRMNGFFSNVEECCVSAVFDRVLFILKQVLKYDVIVLNTHPEDICAIIACGVAKAVNKKIQIHFVNHADHTFSYGSSIADVWYEISYYGKCVDVHRYLTAKKSFLGIPIDSLNSDGGNEYVFNDGDLILTAASSGKYKPNKDANIMPLIKCLLERYKKSSLQIIGADLFRNYWWWRAKIRYGKRLVISKSLPYPDYLKATSAAKLYIDSHPFPGGTAFAEQFLNGRLCTGLVSEFKGYTPAEMFKCHDNEGVLSFIENFSSAELNRVKGLIIDVHGCNSVKSRFRDAILKNMYSCNPVDGYGDNISLNINNSISCIPVNFKCYGVKNLKSLFLISKKSVFLIYLLKALFLKFQFKRIK